MPWRGCGVIRIQEQGSNLCKSIRMRIEFKNWIEFLCLLYKISRSVLCVPIPAVSDAFLYSKDKLNPCKFEYPLKVPVMAVSGSTGVTGDERNGTEIKFIFLDILINKYSEIVFILNPLTRKAVSVQYISFLQWI